MSDDKWKYLTVRVEYNELPHRLNEPGSEGWEAFAVLPGGDTNCLVFFKRRLSN